MCEMRWSRYKILRGSAFRSVSFFETDRRQVYLPWLRPLLSPVCVIPCVVRPETGVFTVAAAALEPCLRDPVCRQTGDRCTYRGCDRTRTTAQGPLPGASSLTVSPASTVDSTCHSLWRTSSHRKVNSPSAACRSSVTLPPLVK